MAPSVPMPNLDKWLPLEEAITQTGMSKRTIYRMVEEGRLRQAQRPIPGRKPLPVFDPADVARLAASTLKANPMTVTATTEAAVRTVAEVVRESMQPLQIADRADNAARHNMAWPVPLVLTEQDAVIYSGYGLFYLRKAVEWRPLGPRGALVCRRSALDAL